MFAGFSNQSPLLTMTLTKLYYDNIFWAIGINIEWQWRRNNFSSKSNLCPSRHFLWKCFTLRILWVLVFCCAKFHKSLWEEFLQEGYKLYVNWRPDLMHTNLPPFGGFWKVFITHLFCKWPLYTLQPAKRKYTGAISKKHENMWISKTQCWALFVISKATFTKTAIKPKFVDRFSLKKFSAAIDQRTVKYLNFVSIENFLSCLT